MTARRDPRSLRPREPGGVRTIGDDERDLGRIGGIRRRGNERRHVRAAAGNQDGDALALHGPLAGPRPEGEPPGIGDAGAGRLDHRAERHDAVAGLCERGFDRAGAVGGGDRHHADAAVERAQHFRLGDSAGPGEPLEHRKDRHAGKVDPHAETWRQDARNVVGQSAAGDVGERFHRSGPADRGEAGRHINQGRREERLAKRECGLEGRGLVPAQALLLHHPADQRKAVGMDARGHDPEHRVARSDVATGQQHVALRSPDGEAGEIVVAWRVEAGHLRGLPANERAIGLAAARRHARDDACADLGIELAAGKIIEEEQRLSALNDEVVHRHCDEVDADRVVPTGLDGDLELGADAVGGGDQDRVLEARPREIEQAAEPADLPIRPRPRGSAHQRLDQVDHPGAGVDVDTGVGVTQARSDCFAHGGWPGSNGGKEASARPLIAISEVVLV